jgi:hypothetical protein
MNPFASTSAKYVAAAGIPADGTQQQLLACTG